MSGKAKVVWLVTLVVVLVLGFWYGDKRGYDRAQAEIKKIQEEAANKAAAEAAKAANPFQVANPLEGVEANPFDKTKSILNPFK